ncbi:hypothetical protein B1U23_06695 (plasmid) [Borreliella burgdorferi]|uniref:hypothetical protein n=1 Tax=Borreliella burgdorferi TaxID=139 RepID=UPI0000057765|nr:hypothetical protein [Borreliella burgdorferi]ARS31027.1 hypothetical protein B1U23_06695 [Borreliella burgdorferi]ARS32285.1 hypothetical protein B1U22_06830 [Borreliella burgdorferi]ARS32768.1 hypothetical protein B1U21_02730 [Borreliella burgdorferi]MCR8876438.1 hypothetical protein [Borreliella burgdorferi]PNL87347.1 hypothetical protein A6J35_006245 [Borreliella burgdorferi]
MKIEKQVDRKITINEIINENGKKTKKLLEIQKDNISLLKNEFNMVKVLRLKFNENSTNSTLKST